MLRDETIQRVLKFRDDRDWRQFHTPKDLAISMSLEAAELLETTREDAAAYADEIRRRIEEAIDNGDTVTIY